MRLPLIRLSPEWGSSRPRAITLTGQGSMGLICEALRAD
jgi:hypothetical protein